MALSPDHPDLTEEEALIRLAHPNQLSHAALARIAKKPIYAWLNGALPLSGGRSDGSHGRALAAINELWDRLLAAQYGGSASSREKNPWQTLALAIRGWIVDYGEGRIDAPSCIGAIDREIDALIRDYGTGVDPG